ncbi:unnamed protein product [Caretta caretta]
MPWHSFKQVFVLAESPRKDFTPLRIKNKGTAKKGLVAAWRIQNPYKEENEEVEDRAETKRKPTHVLLVSAFI